METYETPLDPPLDINSNQETFLRWRHPISKQILHLLLQCLLYFGAIYNTEYPLNSIPTYTKIAISREPALVPKSNLGIQLTILHRLSNKKLKKLKMPYT